MILSLKLLCRVIRRRAAQGESLSAIMLDYPKLSEAERTLVLNAVQQ